jgi:hypothetical protein
MKDIIITVKAHSNKALYPSLRAKKKERKKMKALGRIELFNFFRMFTVVFCTLIQTMWLLRTRHIVFD